MSLLGYKNIFRENKIKSNNLILKIGIIQNLQLEGLKKDNDEI